MVLGEINSVNVGAITTRGVDALDTPTELASVSGPFGRDGRGGTTRVLFFRVDIEEEELVSAAVRLNIRGTVREGPVKAGDERVVGLQDCELRVLVLDIVDVDIVVMGTDS